MAGSRVFKSLQQRRHTSDGPVGQHTMVLAMSVYLCEVNRYLERLNAQAGRLDGADAVALQNDIEPVLEEYRNFETALLGFTRPRNNGRR